jgi:hypothetical protein
LCERGRAHLRDEVLVARRMVLVIPEIEFLKFSENNNENRASREKEANVH